MADRLTAAELEKMQKSVNDMTDLSRNLRSEFTKIKNTTDLLSTNFKQIVTDAKNNLNIAEKYLIAQKTSSVLSEKINELKSKSSYLDSVSLKFKREEVFLQARITNAQITALNSARAKATLDNNERLKAIEALKIQNVKNLAEMQYRSRNARETNRTVTALEAQRQKSDDILNNIELTRDGVIDTNSFMGALGGSFSKLLGKTGLIVNDLGNLGKLIQGSASGVLLLTQLIETGYKNFKDFDKTVVSVRANLGALPGQASEFESLIKEATYESMHLGVSFDDMSKSINEIASDFTYLVSYDKELVKTTAALSKQFGIAEGTSVKFLKTLGGISGNSASSQRSMTGFAQKMAQAAGVPLAKIMRDVADASDNVRLYVGNSAAAIIKAAAAARMMGTNLDKAASTADRLLQFESSLASEMKASALLGQYVNFNYARRLFFNKQLEAGNKEILRITKQVRFNELDPLKQKAYADAAGKSVSELQDMLQQEKNMALVENSTNEKVRKRYAEYKKLMELKEEDAKNEGKIAEQEFLRKANQEKLAQIQNKFNELMSDLADPVMEFTSSFLDLAKDLLPVIVSGLKMGGLILTGVSKTIGYISNKLSGWITATAAFVGPLSRSNKLLFSIGKLILPIITAFGKWLNPIGWVITAFMALKNLMRDFKAYWDDSADWPKKIWTGIKLIGKAIVEAFLPFDSVREKLDKWFFGKSPSLAGKLIMKGFSSIGPELQDSLTQPINNAYKEIEGMTPPDISVENTTTNKLAEKSDNALISAIKTSNQQLIVKMDQLMTMMANGGIAVNLDGQLVSKQLATTAYRSGGFAQSTMIS